MRGVRDLQSQLNCLIFSYSFFCARSLAVLRELLLLQVSDWFPKPGPVANLEIPSLTFTHQLLPILYGARRWL